DSTSEILGVLANSSSHRALLLEYLMAGLSGTSSTEGHQPSLALTAAELIAAEFGNEPLVGNQLEVKFRAIPGNNWFEGEPGWILIALCLGWPSSVIIRQIVDELRESRRQLGLTLAVWHLVCLASPPESVLNNFDLLLQDAKEPSEFWDAAMAR